MYLQITTKCNMKCSHCCYSCTMWGKHMEYSTAIYAIAFAREYGEESISIGGGEPTLHPRFFDILRYCLQDFDYVWMATNGSQTKVMQRLANIIGGYDYESFDYDCNEDDEDKYYDNPELIYQEDKLTVALSIDCFHSRINSRIEEMWKSRAGKRNGYEIRDVTQSRDGAIAEGRAKKTGSGRAEGCVCSDFLIRPDGKVKLCGCSKSPIIGDVWRGIESKWADAIANSERLNDERCYKALKRKG